MNSSSWSRATSSCSGIDVPGAISTVDAEGVDAERAPDERPGADALQVVAVGDVEADRGPPIGVTGGASHGTVNRASSTRHACVRVARVVRGGRFSAREPPRAPRGAGPRGARAEPPRAGSSTGSRRWRGGDSEALPRGVSSAAARSRPSCVRWPGRSGAPAGRSGRRPRPSPAAARTVDGKTPRFAATVRCEPSRRSIRRRRLPVVHLDPYRARGEGEAGDVSADTHAAGRAVTRVPAEQHPIAGPHPGAPLVGRELPGAAAERPRGGDAPAGRGVEHQQGARPTAAARPLVGATAVEGHPQGPAADGDPGDAARQPDVAYDLPCPRVDARQAPARTRRRARSRGGLPPPSSRRRAGRRAEGERWWRPGGRRARAPRAAGGSPRARRRTGRGAAGKPPRRRVATTWSVAGSMRWTRPSPVAA